MKEKIWKYPPRICQWDITAKCNLKCEHCRATASWQKTKDLDIKIVKSILSQLISFAPYVCLAIAGGEPLMRKDLKEILGWLKRKHSLIRTELLTNGTMIDCENIHWLAEFVDGFNISLEGGNAEINDKIRGEGAFKKTINNILHLAKIGLKTAVRMTYFHQGEKEVETLMRLLPLIGVDFFNFRYVVPIGRAECSFVSASQYKRLAQKILELGKELNLKIGFSDPFPNFLLKPEERIAIKKDEELMNGKAVTGCSIAFQLFYLDPQGIVKACPYFPLECADAKKESLEEIWYFNPVLTNLRRIRSLLEDKCGKCRYKFVCGGCRGAAWANGNFLGEDPRCWQK